MQTKAARAIFWTIFAVGEIGVGYFLYETVCKSNYLPCWSIALGMLLAAPIIIVVESVGEFFCFLICQKRTKTETKESTNFDSNSDSESNKKFESTKPYRNPAATKSVKICSRQETLISLPTYSEACVLFSPDLKREANYV